MGIHQGTFDELSSPFNFLFIIFNDHPSAAEYCFGETLNLKTFIGWIVHTHMMRAWIIKTEDKMSKTIRNF